MVHPLLNGLAAELNFKMAMKNRGKVLSGVKSWLEGEGGQPASSLYIFQPAEELNNLAGLQKILKVQISPVLAEDHTVTVSVGAFNPGTDVKVPGKTEDIELKAVLVTLRTDKGRNDVLRYPVSITIPYADAEVGEQTISFPVKPEAGTVFLVGLAVSFMGYRILGMDKNPKWLPAGVLGIGKID
jgi:hypothetical protein